MATKVEAPSGLSVRGRRFVFNGFGAKLHDSWIMRHWQTALMLVLILCLAFFVRTYFAYDIAVDNGYLVSGGSDSYYHERVIDYITTTGQHLTRDPLLNYPFGLNNPRLPLYDWSVAVTGMLGSAITGAPIASSTGYVLDMSTAFWGTLTVIPVFLIGRMAFGNKAGLVGALLFALMAGHIERSVFSNADHDAMMLFFIVFAFYFLLMSLSAIKGDKWVSSYRRPREVLRGFGSYIRMNQVSLIYAMLSGVSMAAVAFAWEGYMYLIIIVLIYFLVQILINRFKNIDSLGVFMSVAVTLATLFILAAPAYWQLHLWGTWFDMPALISVGLIVVGLIFVFTRDLPWTLVIPSFVILVVAALAVLSIVAPNLFDAIITGQGYLVKSKLYSTISEAQAPSFSNLVLSFGVVTFWLALVGLVLAAIKIPKNLSAYLVFIVVWMGAAIFMAMSAGRFVFNAAPVFAIAAGWIVVLIVLAMKFEDIPKGLAGMRLRNPLPALRKGIKIRHVIGVFLLAVMIVLPNAWYAVDAGIPAQTKREYDLQVYNNLPQLLRPSDYDSINGSYWYFGAFTYSLPMPTDYYPAAWTWFAQKDADVTPTVERPAYLSWWDYGFEAIQQGQHPTVADNFQDGYNFAGSFITCTNETQAIAMLVTLAIQGGSSVTSQVNAILEAYGVDVALVRDVIAHPSKYISVVMDNPDIYGSYDMTNTVASAKNALYVFLRVELSSELTKEQLVSVYNDLRTVTGVDVGYFAIDSRLFPFSATGSNIFYAPAKLSDHYIDSYTGAPTDFYQIYAVDSNGNLVEIKDITSDMTIVSYAIIYTDAFYETMLYRAFMGFGPADLGLTEQGLPGLSGSLVNYAPMQGWNMSNFRLVYKTAYYNPFPASLVQNHSDAWQAIGYDEAVSIQAKINAGTMTGVVDTSASTLQSGVVFLQYYDGAIVRGQATAENGNPYPNAYVTVLDEYGIPHQTVKTDANGNYEVIAPFGNVSVVFSVGSFNNRTQLADTELGRISLSITYDQAMRIGEYIFDRNIVLSSSTVSGRIYWNLAGGSSYSSTSDQAIGGATVYLVNETIGYSISTTTADDGTYTLEGVPPMYADVFAMVDGHKTNVTTIQVKALVDKTVDIAITPASISGKLAYPDGTAVSSFDLDLTDLVNGTTMVRTTASDGSFFFGMLLPGEYELASSDQNMSLGTQIFDLTQGQAVSRTFTLYNAMTISGQILTQSQLPAANITIGLVSQNFTVYMQTDSNGRFEITMPSDNYTLYSVAVINSKEYAALTSVPAASGTVHVSQTLQQAGIVTGRAYGTAALEPEVRFQSRTTGAVFYIKANESGNFAVVLPLDNYFIYIDSVNTAYWADVFVSGDMALNLNLVASSDIYGVVWYDANDDGAMETSERISDVAATVSDADGRTIVDFTASDGSYRATLVPGRAYTTSVNVAGYEPQSFTVTLGSSVTHDFELVPYNRTVSGTVTYGSSALSGVTVTFKATGSGAVTQTAVTDGLGRFSVSLHPGTYSAVIAENATLGSNATQYQYTESLTVAVGSDPSPQAIHVARRVLVSVTLSSPSTATKNVVISGPDSSTRQTTANFTVYLQPGTYNVYAYQERFGQRYASLAAYDISTSSTSIAISLTSAFQVTGDLSYSGSRFTKVATVTVTNLAGGTYSFSSATTGTFTVILPSGDFNISADARLKQEISTDVQRYVRYQGYQDLSLAANANIHLTLSRSFDNATVVGHALLNGGAISATLQLAAITDTAVNATIAVTASGYNFSVAPGNYSVYAREIGGTSAFLGLLVVEPYETNYVNLTLVQALPFSGSTTVNGIGTQATFEISNGYQFTTTTAADGSFSIYLPPGTYDVKATAHGVELGISATYTSEFTLNMTGSQSRTIVLTKVASHGVELTWDSSQKQTISGGQTVAYTIRVVNTGNVADTFVLTASGATSSWTMTFSQSRVNLGFGQNNSQLITVYITAPANAKVNHQTLSVRATSATVTSVLDSVTLEVGILPHYGASLDYYKASSTSGTTFSYSLNVTNSGNVDDSFNVTVVNAADLAQLGWKAEVRTGSGSFSSYFVVSVSAGSKASFELRLTAIRANPEPLVTVVLTATSQASPSTVATLPFVPALPKFTVPSNGMSVSGNGVVQTIPNLPSSTLILLGLVIAMFTVLVMVSWQKGVLRRRKR